MRLGYFTMPLHPPGEGWARSMELLAEEVLPRLP